MASPGPLIGKGRSADIYQLPDGTALRRLRTGTIPEAEPLVMAAARAGGFPAPEVFAVDGADMTMERVDGPDLLTQLTRRPWYARRIGELLAELHHQLASTPSGDTGLKPKFGDAEALVHGDLHPGNIIMTGGGPVVIDWEGSGLGPADADTAITWLLLETAEPDDIPLLLRPLLTLIRRTMLRAFLANVPTPRRATIAEVCRMRLGDTNMRPVELDRIRAFADRHAA